MIRERGDGLGLKELACSTLEQARKVVKEKERDVVRWFKHDQIRSSQKKDRGRDDPLQEQIKSKRLECGGTCMAHAN